MTPASLIAGPVEFDSPHWLWLIPILGGLAAWIARRSLSGLGSVTRWVSLVIRVVVIALVSGALAEPAWRKESKDVAVNVIVDVSDSVPRELIQQAETFLETAAKSPDRRPNDRLGIVTTARSPMVQQLPSKLNKEVELQHSGPTDATDLAAAKRLAAATSPPDAASRVVLVTDGQETQGSLLQAVRAASARGTPIDILALRYSYAEEVIMDRLVVPGAARLGENMMVKIVLQATRPTMGRVSLRINGEPEDLSPDDPTALSAVVELKGGPQTFQFPTTARRRGPQRYEADFEPFVEGGKPVGDTRLENNRQAAITFVSGEGRVLVMRNNSAESDRFVGALTEARIAVDEIAPVNAPEDLAGFNAYDAIVAINIPRSAMTELQWADLKRYVHESGGGLLMIGGPESFGAGGLINSPIEDALPIKLDPPQKREMPRGALALLIHSVEMPEGVFYGKEVCRQAVRSLSRLDLAGIVEDRSGVADWAHPISLIGDGSAINQSIAKLQFGDMQTFEPSMRLVLAGLLKAQAGQKHVIMISDGDPQPPSNKLLSDFRQARITISCVAIACHGTQDQQTMRNIARATNGRFYDVDPRDVAQLPNIFIKEAQTVKRSLIEEGSFSPKYTGLGGESFRGVTPVPNIRGYVVAADREGLATVTLRGKENDPVMAQWQFGLGKVIAFTSDVSSRWGGDWLAWPRYRGFWEQQLRWVMRPTGSPNIRVTTETRDDETLVVVDALDARGQRLSFARFTGRASTPDGGAEEVVIDEVGPGRYEGRFRSEAAGTYIINLRYRAPGEGKEIEGTVQAAVNRPFATEYRTLTDNAALLEQVRAQTGGRDLAKVVGRGTPDASTLWFREGLVFPVASRPIWLIVTVLALGMFLMDVAVRRVRIDVLGMARALRRALNRGQDKVTEMQSLRAARDKAKRTIEQRAAITPDPSAPGAASVKFEATEDELRAARGGPAAMGQPHGIDGGASTAPPTPKSAKQDTAEGMSALLRAKRRARDDIQDR